MRDIAAKTDNTGDTLAAAAFNANLRTEVQAVVTQTGQTLDAEAGPDTDQNMLGKAIARYSSDGGFYQDSGAANAYVLGRVGNIQPVPAYFDGEHIVFVAGNTNTGASTVNVTTRGSKDIRRVGGGVVSAGDLVAGAYIECRFDAGNDYFEYLGVGSIPLLQAYASPGQTITSSGIIALAHGFGKEPGPMQYVLQCTSAEFGYSVGDRVAIDFNVGSSVGDKSNTPVIDATNITVQFTDAVSAFTITTKGGGARADLTNASWQLYVKAWA